MTSLLLLVCLALPPQADPPYRPDVKPASDAGARAIAGFHVADGLQITLFAAEPMLANPVAFCIDHRGRFYVCETFRIHEGVVDLRDHMDWLDEELANQTVEDRMAMVRRHEGAHFATYDVEHERVRRLEDRDGDGVADHATVFADSFNDPADGLAAGVLARGGRVYLTCMPNLWLLEDRDDDGVADVRTSLSRGYGVKHAMIGHDLHGLRLGPDGKLYFSCGDRALNVPTPRGPVKVTTSGAVLRCNLDGSDLEIFHTGLRNPQELVFDERGDLFTGDNNSDGGDRARLVHLVEGGDSGWRFGYQWMKEPYLRGPWNAERLWHPRFAGQAAAILPPIVNLGEGPAGFTHDTGTGLLPRYRGHFFLADFHGDASSLVHAFTLLPHGATFAFGEREDLMSGCLVTDLEVGMDGALYVSDWVQGWKKTGLGRLYRLAPPGLENDPLVRATRELLAQGMAARAPDELARLLAHADQRVRQEAQLELAARGAPAVPTLAGVARANAAPLARLHAVWGLGQLASKQPAALEALRPLLADDDAEVRAQTARVLGDARDAAAGPALAGRLTDESARVRFFAAIALGKLPARTAFDDAVDFLRANADADVYLRHAGVMALAGLADAEQLLGLARDRSFGVRLAAVLALRRQASPRVERFLGDADPLIVLEAARAINDLPLAEALPALAALIEKPDLDSEALLRRVLNASFRLGAEREQRRVAAFAARASAPAAMRCEALVLLREWAAPGGRDRVMGEWRPLPPRDGSLLAELARQLEHDLADAPDEVRAELARLCAHLGVRTVVPQLFTWLGDAERSSGLRVACLDAIATLAPERLSEAVLIALVETDPGVSRRGCELLEQLAPDFAMPLVERALADGSVPVQQGALHALGRMTDPRAEQLLIARFDGLAAGTARPEIQLDVLEAARASAAPALGEKVQSYETGLPAEDLLAPFRVCLQGGDAAKGEQIFVDKAEVSCLRCHQVGGRGGKIGPALDGVGTRRTRDQLLSSLIEPNREIVEGYGKVLLFLRQGGFCEGRVIGETEASLRLLGDDGIEADVARGDISERRDAFSAMPENLRTLLTPAEVRDLIEYLAQLK